MCDGWRYYLHLCDGVLVAAGAICCGRWSCLLRLRELFVVAAGAVCCGCGSCLLWAAGAVFGLHCDEMSD